MGIPGKLTFGVYWALQDTFNEEPYGQSLGCPPLCSSVGRAVLAASSPAPGIWLHGLQVSCSSQVGPPGANQTWASSVHGFLALTFELPHQTPPQFPLGQVSRSHGKIDSSLKNAGNMRALISSGQGHLAGCGAGGLPADSYGP